MPPPEGESSHAWSHVTVAGVLSHISHVFVTSSRPPHPPSPWPPPPPASSSPPRSSSAPRPPPPTTPTPRLSYWICGPARILMTPTSVCIPGDTQLPFLPDLFSELSGDDLVRRMRIVNSQSSIIDSWVPPAVVLYQRASVTSPVPRTPCWTSWRSATTALARPRRVATSATPPS